MHLPWLQDERPVWRVRCAFDLVRSQGARAGDSGSRRLEREIAATGTVRRPRVRVIEGRAVLTLLVRGTDEVEASHRGLSAVDVATAQVPGLTLGELRGLTATLASPHEDGEPW